MSTLSYTILVPQPSAKTLAKRWRRILWLSRDILETFHIQNVNKICCKSTYSIAPHTLWILPLIKQNTFPRLFTRLSSKDWLLIWIFLFWLEIWINHKVQLNYICAYLHHPMIWYGILKNFYDIYIFQDTTDLILNSYGLVSEQKEVFVRPTPLFIYIWTSKKYVEPMCVLEMLMNSWLWLSPRHDIIFIWVNRHRIKT